MTREHKLALIIGFSVMLVVAILVADHLSPAQQDRLASLDVRPVDIPSIALPEGLINTTAGPRGPRVGSERTTWFDQPDPRADERSASGRNDAPTVDASRSSQQRPPVEEAAEAIVMGESESVAEAPDRLHIVLEGETLYGIAQRYYGDGSFFEELALYNADRVMENGRVRQGVALRVPDREVLLGRTNSTRRPAQRDAQPASPQPRYVEYTIRRNDRLWDIAKGRLGSGARWREIADLNKDVIRNPDVLPVGRTIRIPVR